MMRPPARATFCCSANTTPCIRESVRDRQPPHGTSTKQQCRVQQQCSLFRQKARQSFFRRDKQTNLAGEDVQACPRRPNTSHDTTDLTFPAPLWPSRAVICPEYMVRSNLSTASLEPPTELLYTFVRPDRSVRSKGSKVGKSVAHSNKPYLRMHASCELRKQSTKLLELIKPSKGLPPPPIFQRPHCSTMDVVPANLLRQREVMSHVLTLTANGDALACGHLSPEVIRDGLYRRPPLTLVVRQH